MLWLYAYDEEYRLVWPRQVMVLVPPAQIDGTTYRLPGQEAELYLLMLNGGSETDTVACALLYMSATPIDL